MCLSELERRGNCLLRLLHGSKRKGNCFDMVWLFHCSNKANYATCFLIYFILTPVSLPLLSANTISVKSAQLILCPKLVLQFMGNPSFPHVFSSQPEFYLNKEYGAALCCWPSPSWALALAPSHCKALQVIRLISPHPHISHLDYFHLQRVTCLGMCWYHHFEHFSGSYLLPAGCQGDLQVQIFLGAPKPLNNLGTAFPSLSQRML